MIIIEITSTEIKTRSGTSARTGNPYTMREQIGYLHKAGDPYPEKIKISLEDNQPPYHTGNYDLSPSSFYVDKYDSLSVRPVLVSRPAEVPMKPASVPAGVVVNK
jgi:hypothetical protein